MKAPLRTMRAMLMFTLTIGSFSVAAPDGTRAQAQGRINLQPMTAVITGQNNASSPSNAAQSPNLQPLAPAGIPVQNAPKSPSTAVITTQQLAQHAFGNILCLIHNSTDNTEHVLIQGRESDGTLFGNNEFDISAHASVGVSTSSGGLACEFNVDREAVAGLEADDVVTDATGRAVAALPGFPTFNTLRSLPSGGPKPKPGSLTTIATAPMAPRLDGFSICEARNDGDNTEPVQIQVRDENGNIVGNNGIEVAAHGWSGVEGRVSDFGNVFLLSCEFIVDSAVAQDFQVSIQAADSTASPIVALPGYPTPATLP
jgi:hypothetical protein